MRRPSSRGCRSPREKQISRPKRLSSIEVRKTLVAEPKPGAVYTKPDDPASRVSFEQVKEAWQNIIESVTRTKISIGTYLNEGLPIKLENGLLTVSFSREHSLHKESLERKENRELIEKGIAGLLHADIRIDFLLSKEEKSVSHSENNTTVRSALDLFNGRLIREG